MNIVQTYTDSFESATMTDKEKYNLIKESETIFIPSGFNFLKEIKGIRPGKITSLLAPSGVGKSTLARSIAIEAAKNGIVYYWLTEEKKEEFKLGLAKANISNSILNNIKIFSEIDCNIPINIDPSIFINQMESKLKLMNPILIICDNLTTSSIYMDRFDIQGEVVGIIGKLVSNLDCGFLTVLHTKSEITDNHRGLICIEDVRGKKIISIKSDYFYVMQVFKTDYTQHVTIRLDKHRHTSGVRNKLFLLDYSRDKNMYVSDRIINFAKFKELFDQRNIL